MKNRPEVSVLARDAIDRGLTAAMHFLRQQQSPDGAWRSQIYGFFKDGTALTPLAAHILLTGTSTPETTSCAGRGAAYLAALARPDGTINEGPHGLSYPAYTAALTVLVLSHPLVAEHRKARDAWLSYLRERQLTEVLGWQPADRAYGGWGYAHSLPRKPQPGQPADLLTESNLSATVFALEALRGAGCPVHEPLFGKALTFVRRCENFADDPDPAFDDGGFHFMYDDSLRNKAGVAGTDRVGRERYNSYGSMTADGLRALLACGVPLDDPRVSAARCWLDRHFSAVVHPGRFAAGRAVLQASSYYYYCWSLTRALAVCGPGAIMQDRAAELAEELLRRQQADGSWVNAAVEMREDDPLVATPLAVLALAECGHAFGKG
jgi:squalene-hopene/tetraprenyl-beta-curcumene cyclase